MNLCYAALQCYASPSLSSHHGSAPLQPNEKDISWRREAQSTSKGRLHQFDAFTVATTHGPRQVDWWPGLWRGCMAPRKSVANVMCSWAMLWCEGHGLHFLEARLCTCSTDVLNFGDDGWQLHLLVSHVVLVPFQTFNSARTWCSYSMLLLSFSHRGTLANGEYYRILSTSICKYRYLHFILFLLPLDLDVTFFWKCPFRSNSKVRLAKVPMSTKM